MFDRFEISNFKAFGGTPGEFQIKPITLLFGPNSAGKSSVLHSLLWMSHVGQTGELDIRKPGAADGHVDLGGFRQFTHRNDPANRIRCAFTVSQDRLSRIHVGHFGIKEGITYEFTCAVVTNEEQLVAHVDDTVQKARAERLAERSEGEAKGIPPDPTDELMDSWMLTALREKLIDDLKYRFFRGDTAPYLQTVSIRVDGNEVLRATAKQPGPLMVTILDVPFVLRPSDYLQNLLDVAFDAVSPDPEGIGNLIEAAVNQGLIFFSGGDGGLPSDLRCHDDFCRKWKDASVAGDAPADVEAVLKDINREIAKISKLFADMVGEAQTTTGSMVYIPPLRELPARFGGDFGTEEDSPWKTLRTDETVRGKVNHWLSADFLQTRYEFRTDAMVSLGAVKDTLLREMEDLVHRKHQEFEEGAKSWYDEEEEDPYEAFQKPIRNWSGEAEGKRIFEEVSSKTAPGALADLALYDKRAGIRVSLRDVGVGVSQLLPVLVESYANRGKLIAIEQPEIHIHPALQAELADVFIESALGESKNTFLLETHSEHLILRILKRIRQTTIGKLPPGSLPITKDDVAVLFVKPMPDGAVVRELRIDDKGKFLDSWPGGFFEESFNEMF